MTITLMIAAVAVEPGWAVGTVTPETQAIGRDILLDAAGRPWVPGSALAGSLRAHLRRASVHDEVRLMGSRPPRDRAEAQASTVSPLWIVGSVSVYLRHDPGRGRPLDDDDLRLIAGWRPAIGRDRTRGCGRAALTSLRYGTVDPATPAGAETWLSHDGPELFEAVATREIPGGATGGEPWLEARFEIVDGLLTGDGTSGPVARPRRRLGQPLIPGSTWKGIIRSRTEYIIRSVYGEPAACRNPTGCGECVTCEVFGHQGQRGKLAFGDSYVEDARDTSPPLTHVGIDRVTGGARDALLFQTAPLAGGELRLRIDALGDVEPWVGTVIRHVLRDIGDGLVGVGSRTTRGLGTLRLADALPDPGPVGVPALAAAQAR